MNLEITKDQFDLINEEITKLENDKLKLFNVDSLSGWEIIHIEDRIDLLKNIIRTEIIEI